MKTFLRKYTQSALQQNQKIIINSLKKNTVVIISVIYVISISVSLQKLIEIDQYGTINFHLIVLLNDFDAMVETLVTENTVVSKEGI